MWSRVQCNWVNASLLVALVCPLSTVCTVLLNSTVEMVMTSDLQLQGQLYRYYCAHINFSIDTF